MRHRGIRPWGGHVSWFSDITDYTRCHLSYAECHVMMWSSGNSRVWNKYANDVVVTQATLPTDRTGISRVVMNIFWSSNGIDLLKGGLVTGEPSSWSPYPRLAVFRDWRSCSKTDQKETCHPDRSPDQALCCWSCEGDEVWNTNEAELSNTFSDREDGKTGPTDQSKLPYPSSLVRRPYPSYRIHPRFLWWATSPERPPCDGRNVQISNSTDDLNGGNSLDLVEDEIMKHMWIDNNIMYKNEMTSVRESLKNVSIDRSVQFVLPMILRFAFTNSRLEVLHH